MSRVRRVMVAAATVVTVLGGLLAETDALADPADPDLTFTSIAPDPARVGAHYRVEATGRDNGQPIRFSIDPSTTSAACSISDDTVTFDHVGTCVVAADQDGDENTAAAVTAVQSVTVVKGRQTIAFTADFPDAATVGDAGVTVAANGGASGNDVTFSIDETGTAGACDLAGAEVTPRHVGTCAVAADQAGTDDYAPADRVVRTFEIAARDQSVAFLSGAPTGAVVAGPGYVPIVTGGSSDYPVVLSVDPSTTDAACSLDDDTVQFRHVGSCSVRASVDGDQDNRPASVVQTFTVGKGVQALSLGALHEQAAVGGSEILDARPGGSSSPVVYRVDESTTNGACGLADDRLVYHHPGQCTVVAEQAGDVDYDDAWPVQRSVQVQAGPVLIYYMSDTPTDAAVGGTPYLVSADAYLRTADYSADTTVGELNLLLQADVHFSIGAGTTNGSCTLDEHTVSFVHAGRCVIAADVPADGDYAAADTTTQVLTVGKAAQRIDFDGPGRDGVVDTSATLVATGGVSGPDFRFSVDPTTTNDACVVTGDIVRYRHAGTCVLAADKAGDDDHLDAPTVTASVRVLRGSQGIVFDAPADGAAVGQTELLHAVGGASGNPVVFAVDASTTNDACTVVDDRVTYRHIGNCVLNAYQFGGDDYTNAPVVAWTVPVGIGAQTISFDPLAPAPAVGSSETLTVTGGGSGQPVVLAVDPLSSTVGACTVDTVDDEGTTRSVVHYRHVGTCALTADQAGNDDWSPAWQVQRSTTVVRAAQTVALDPLSGPAVVGGSETLHGTGGPSGAAISFAVDPDTTDEACVVDGALLRFVHVGTCTVSAQQAGSDDYAASPAATLSVEVGKGSQSISVDPFGVSAAVGDVESLSATGGASGNPVTYTLIATDPVATCALDGYTLTYVHAGTCTVTAHQDGSDDYEAAWDVQRSVTVAKAVQAIDFDALDASATVYGTQILHAIGGASGNPVVFTVDAATTNGACTIDGDTVTFDHAGTCVVAADQTGDADHTDAWTATRTVTVARAPQTIEFDALSADAVVDGSEPLSARGGRSGNAVSFAVDPDATTNAACALDGTGSTITYRHAGLCVIGADQAGDADHGDAVSVTRTVTVGRAPQSLDFTSAAPSDAVVGGPVHHLTASGGASGNTMMFSVNPSTTNGACSVAGADVSFVHAGVCVLAVDQLGSADYLSAPTRLQSFAVGRGPQMITFDALSSDAAVGASETLRATGGPSGAPVTLEVDAATTNGACTIVDGRVQYRHVGMCAVTARQGGTSDYTAAVAQTRQVDVGRGTQTITFDALTGGASVGGSAVLHAVGGGSGQLISYVVDADTTGNACTVVPVGDGYEVRYQHVGRCVLDARQDGNADYFDAWSMQRSATVGQAGQTISFTSLAPTDAVVGDSYVVTALGGGSGAPVTFGSDGGTTNSACTISGSTVVFQHVGTCTVAADQAGSADYLAAPTRVQSFAVGRHTQTIAFTTAVPGDAVVGNSYAVAAVGGAGGAPVTFAPGAGTTNSACTVSASTVVFDHVGICVVTADQAGSGDYLPAPTSSQSFAVGKGAQTIDFTSTVPTSATVGGTPYVAAAAGSAGTAPIIYTVAGATTNSACTVSGSTVAFRHVGTCVVAADRAADADHVAAATRVQSFAVAKGSQTIDFTAPAGAAVDGTALLQASGGAAATPVTFSVDTATTNSACTLSGSTVTYRHVGNCVLVAQQLGNADYADAWPVQRSVTVGKGVQTVVFTAGAPSQAAVGGASYTPRATGGASANPVVFTVHTSTTRSACSIDANGSVGFTHAGTCVIAADQAADADHVAAATTTLSIPVVRAVQSIDVTASTPPKVDLTAAMQALGGRAGAAVTLAVGSGTTNSSCLVTGTIGNYTIAFKHAGTCVVSAAETGDADYLPFTGTRTFTVAKGAQSISVTTTAPATATVGETYRPTATAPAGGVTVATVGAACSVNAGAVTFDHQGTCTITFDQSGAADYEAADRVSQSVTVSARPTTGSVSVSSSPTVFGEPVRATATVTSTNGATPSGAVQFAVDGVASGSPVTLVGGAATSAALTGQGGAVLRPGSRAVTATFVPVDPTVNAASVATATQVVRRAGTTAGVSVSSTKLTATVDVVAPGAGAPSGTVTFTVAGSPVGTAGVLRGVATLAYSVPSGAGRQVAAVYNGDDLFTSSSASLTRQDPVVVATVTSSSARNAAGWYRAPVTVQFTCAPNGAPLVSACPDPVVLDTDGAAQSVSRTLFATDGGAQTVVVDDINIDRVVPHVAVSGVTSGSTYAGTTPKPSCTATDTVSGVASCTLTQTSKTTAAGRDYTYRVTATDRAGNTSSTTGSYSVLTRYLSGATYRSGAFEVKIGKTYTVVVTSSSSRPTYYKISTRTPTVKSSAFRAAGASRWTLPVGMSTTLRAHTYWYLGVRVGSTTYSLKLKIVR